MLLNLAPKIQAESSQNGVCYSQQFLNCNRRDLAELIFDFCADCCKPQKMSSIPQGSFAVRQVHSNITKQSWDLAINKTQGYEKLSSNQMYQVNQLGLDHPLAKYNSKLMKSIWGMYNRYSVHNLKSFTAGENNHAEGGQQLQAAAPPASSSSSSKGGFKKNGTLSNPVWDALRSGHTY